MNLVAVQEIRWYLKPGDITGIALACIPITRDLDSIFLAKDRIEYRSRTGMRLGRGWQDSFRWTPRWRSEEGETARAFIQVARQEAAKAIL